ncbi:hypothetical protein Leryth_011458 [Lithospermum erythrorhizon]|nr:hypothetical protein Leryth_011458 [Lithospermum erythrorhizon]
MSSHESTFRKQAESLGKVKHRNLTVQDVTQDEDIVKWVKRQLQSGQIAELLEPGLLELDPESSEWEEYLLGIKLIGSRTIPTNMGTITADHQSMI